MYLSKSNKTKYVLALYYLLILILIKFQCVFSVKMLFCNKHYSVYFQQQNVC